MVQTGISKLLALFPDRGFSPVEIDTYNRLAATQFDQVRDFFILHYHATRREDSPFWRACRGMDIPASLAHRISLFRETARFFRAPNELFGENSWIQVMLGQGILPESHHPAADLMGDAELSGFLNDIKMQVDRTVAQLPSHQAYVEQYCRAPEMAA
jgi:tryptophan halogenase